jgi:predicted nucleic acid-binding protein
MKLVVDANAVISCLVTKAVTFDVFLLNSVLKKLEFLAPEFLWIEVDRHKEELLEETKLTKDDFE